MTQIPRIDLTRYRDRFVNRGDTWCLQQATGRYQRVRRPLGDDELARHLFGDQTVAVDSVAPDGLARWLCLDSDASTGIADLRRVVALVRELGLSSALEASRRGGHLWLWWSTPQPAKALRRLGQWLIGHAGVVVEVYPAVDAPAPNGVTQPVRLPFGIHQVTGQRYPFLDDVGRPCHRVAVAEAVAWLIGQPRNTTADLQAALIALADHPLPTRLGGSLVAPGTDVAGAVAPGRAYGVIAWVKGQSLAALIADTRGDVALRRAGRGYIGWCPFHDDNAPQDDGAAGTPSLYVYCDAVHGWHWRCLSTHCGAHQGKVKDGFDWLVWCSGGQWRRAVQWGQALQEEATERQTTR